MKIVKEPDVFLKSETRKIEFPLDIDNKKLIGDMIQTMYDNNGIGLAANQVGYNRKIFVMDVSNEKDNPQVFINPEITSKNNIKMGDVEGCLSCPGQQIKVSRSISVNLDWFCVHGKRQHKTFYHLPCRVVQHEMDHLNGKLILDYRKGGQ
jgi:peptide deformylase